MTTDHVEALAQRLEKECEKTPDLAAAMNLLVWTHMRVRIGELPEDNKREQAENAFDTLASLLSDDDQIENDPEEIE